MRALARHPVLHFFALGGLLYAAMPGAPHSAIVIDAAKLEQLSAQWTRETGRPPSTPELEASLQREAQDEALVREAARLGLTRSDPVVRQRLVANMRFAFPGREAGDDALIEEALALDMDAHDLVVRRRLVARMEQRLGAEARVDEREVRDHFERHAADFASPARRWLRHVFYSSDRRGPRARDDAARALPRVAPAAPAADPFLAGHAFHALTDRDIDRLFGAGFAQALPQAASGWVGPIPSAYGYHLVRVERFQPASVPAFESVRSRVELDLLSGRREAVVREARRKLVTRYGLSVQGAAS